MRPKTEMRAYQDRLVTFLYEHDEALCVVRPGGGKTIAALTAINELLRDKVIRHALVIAPKRVALTVWPAEIAEWMHTEGLQYQILDGSPRQRQLDLARTRQVDITIVGIDHVAWLMEQLDAFDDVHRIYDLLVLDEISKFRDPTGVRVKALAKRAERWNMIWGLSGTLRPSSALDLFMPVRVVTRGKLWGRSFYQWRKPRFYPTDYKGYDWAPFPGAEDQIHAELAPLAVTLRADELPQLPELSIILDRVMLPPKALRIYHDMHVKLLAETGENKVLAANSAVATGKLAQIANGFLYDGDDKDEAKPDRVTLAIHDEKREWLTDLVEAAAGPTLLVYQYHEDLALLREVCGEDLPYLGAGVSNAVSDRHIRNWNAGKLPFLALHPASAGHGLNLQHGGCDMAWLAPTWSPEMWEQTIARLHRSGQTRPVIVRACVATGTVDDMKLDRVHHKMSAQAAFEKYLASFTGVRP
jgi:SNF2 family DNA or RNA helicase